MSAASLATSVAESTEIPTSAVSDPSIIVKVPVLKRLSYAKGWGAGLALRVNAPFPGAQDAFAGDGAVTFNPTILADYRFGIGARYTR